MPELDRLGYHSGMPESRCIPHHIYQAAGSDGEADPTTSGQEPGEVSGRDKTQFVLLWALTPRSEGSFADTRVGTGRKQRGRGEMGTRAGQISATQPPLSTDWSITNSFFLA